MVETQEFADEYFRISALSNDDFWKRFGGEPDWCGLRVLDLGCGHGAMSVRIGRAGGTVVGVDLNEERIDYAKRNLALHFPDLSDKVTFAATDATKTLSPDKPFDVIVSKDTFEHVEDPALLLTGLGKLLTPSGRIYAGFSPLFFSPFGDHGNLGLRFPWAHAVLPEKMVYAAASRIHSRPVNSPADVGLNGKTPEDFRRAFEASGLQLYELHYNRGEKRLLRVLEVARTRLPRLEKYTTVSMYAVFGRNLSGVL